MSLTTARPCSRAVRGDLAREQAARRRRNLQPPAAVLEPIEMQVEPADAPVARGHRLEQAVAVREPAIRGIDAGRLSVHEPERVHGATRARLMQVVL